MKKNLINPVLSWRLGLLSLLLAGASPAIADDLTSWGTGATANWSDPLNWTNLASANAVPANGDNIIFSAALVQPGINNDLTNLSIGSLTFSSGDFTVAGNALSIAAGITNAAGNNAVANPLTLGAAQSFDTVAGSTLSFLGGAGTAATITNAGYALTLLDAGDFNLFGAVSGTGSLTMAGTGNLIITNRQPLTGGIFVNSGLVTVSALGNLNFGGALTPSLITVNTNGTILGNGTHAIGGGTSMFINRGIWQLNFEDYKQNITMWDGSIEPGPSPNSSGGELRVGSAGGSGSWTWYVSNSVAGSTISSPLNTIGSGVTLTLDVARGQAASDLTISGAIKNSGNLIFNRNGITTLSGPNTQTGNLTINGGTVKLTSSALLSSTITVASNAVFDVSGSSFSLAANQILTGVGTVIGTINDGDATAFGSAISPAGSSAGTLTMDNLTLQGNALALNFNLSTVTTVGAGVNDLITVTNLTLATGATNIVNFAFSGTPAAGAYTLIQYPLGQGPAAGPITSLAAAASRSTYIFSSTGTSIQVTVVANPAPLVWRGDGATNTWDLGITTNWINGVVKDAFLTGDNATFNDTGSNTPPVNLTGALSANIVTVNATKDYVFGGTGKITGGAKLMKSNSGNLTILTPNDNTGGGSLNGSGTVTVGSGGSTVANLGTGTLTNNTKVTFFEGTSVTYAGSMTGNGSVVSFMPGATLTLTGTNTFTGGLVAANGTTQIGNATPGSSVVGNITNYSTLNIYRSDAFTNQNYITSAGNNLEYGNGDINVRGIGGMTVDGTAPITCLGSFSVSQSAYGKVTVNPGGFIGSGGFFLLGNPTSNNGDLIQNGGVINATNTFRVGHWGSEISTYTLNGGTVNVPFANLAVGWDGIGLMTMTNGTINCRGLNVDDNGATAAFNGNNSTFTLTGGNVNVGVNGLGGNTAIYKLSGGTIAAAAPAGFSSTMAMIMTNGSPTFDSSNSVITLSGILSGNGGLIKQGSGYLNLNGANTYTNTTTVTAGTLQGSGTISGPLVVQSGATLSAGTTLATGTLTTSNVTLSAGANLVMDLSSTSTTSDLLYARGSVAFNSTPLLLNFLGGQPVTNGTYTIVSNLVSPRTGTLVYNNPTRYAATLDQSQANRVQLSFAGTNANLVWKGNVSPNWNVNADANWLNNGVADKYLQSDSVIFDDSGIAVSNVTLAATMTPASVTVDTAGSYSFAGGEVAGLGTVTKSGAGTLTLSNNLNQTGGTIVTAGTLKIGNGGTSGYVAGNITDYGSVVFNRSDTVTYGVNPVNAAASVITGPGSLTQAGSGKLVIVATMNHYGGTTINPGSTLQLGNGPIVDSGSLGNSPATNNGTINFYRLSSIAVATPYAGNGAFNFLGTGNSGQSGYSLNATNTFTGPVTLNLARIQSGLGALSFGNPSSINVLPGSQVYAVATPYSSIYNLPLTLTGTGWQDGLGALRIENGGTWAGPITLAANSRIGVNSASSNNITGIISGNYELETYGGNALATLVLAPSAPNTYNALRVSIGTAGAKTIAGNANAIPNNIPLTMNGGILWLNGFSKSFSSFLNLNGSSSIQNGSTTSPATVSLVPPLGSSTYAGTFADGANQPLNVTLTQASGLWTMALSGTSANWTGNITNNGGTVSSAIQNTTFGSQGVIGRNIVGNNGATFITTINNVLAGYSGNVILNKSTWICNRYISMNANAGYLSLANSTITGTNSSDGAYENWSLPSTVLVRGTAPSYLLGGGTSPAFDLQSGGTTFDVADATGNPSSDLIVGGGTSTTFLHPPANSSSGGSLTKIGNGTMELDGANTYTGPTIINAGTLALGASGSLISPTISIASGAKLDVSAFSGGWTLPALTLSGSGTVAGSLNDGSGIAILPGGLGIAGTLTVTTNLTLGGSCPETFDLSGNPASGNDKIIVGGTLTLSSSAPTPLTFTFLNGAPALGVPYTLFQCGSISGTLANAFTNSPAGYTATYSQVGNSIVVTFGGSVTNLVWTGTDPAIASTWDVATSTNWFDGTSDNIFYQFDPVVFDNTSVNTTVTLNATVTPTGITVDSTNNYTISGTGSIAGNTGLTKNNTNVLNLSTANAFTGPVLVNGGVLFLGNAGALPQNANVLVTNGAQIDFNGQGNSTTRNYSFTIGGSGPDGSGAINNSSSTGIFGNASVTSVTLTTNATIGGSGRWDLGSGQTGTLLNGNGYNLTKVGAMGMSIRPQLITNVASITLSNGSAWYEAFNQTNAWTSATTNYIQPGTSLGNYGALMVNVPIVLDGATILNQGGGSPAVWTGGIRISNSSLFNNGAAQNFSGPISGPGAMWVNGGTAALTLSNASTYAGGTVISNAPTTTAAVDATAGSAAVIAVNPSAFGTGPITISGLSQPALATNAFYFTTNVFRAVEFAFSAPGTVPNAIVLPSSVITNVSLHGRDSGQFINLSGVISGGFLNLTNWVDFGDGNANGVMRYGNPANTFVGNVTAFRGVLAITADGSLGNAANLLRLNNSGGLRFDGANINVAHAISVTAATTFSVFGDNDASGIIEFYNAATISGIISGGSAITVAGGISTAGNSAGSLTLGGNNTFTGALTVNSDTKVIASHINGLGTTAGGTTVNAGGTLSLSANGTYASEPLTINGVGVQSGGTGLGALENLSGNNTLGGTISLGIASTIGVTSGTLTLGGVISGANPLTKVGPGSLTLTGAETYSAGTIVNNGALFLNGSLPVGSAVSVSSSGTLGGNGTINAPVTIQTGATLAPGVNAIGKLIVNGPLNLFGTTVMELNKSTATNDQVAAISTMLYSGSLVVTNLGGTLTLGDTFKLFSALSYQGGFATVSLPALGANLAWSNSLALNGSLQVVTNPPAVSQTPVKLNLTPSATSLTLQWPADHTGWRLLAQTNNLLSGISSNTNDWTTVSGSAATNQVSIPVDPAKPTEFYRLVYP